MVQKVTLRQGSSLMDAVLLCVTILFCAEFCVRVMSASSCHCHSFKFVQNVDFVGFAVYYWMF